LIFSNKLKENRYKPINGGKHMQNFLKHTLTLFSIMGPSFYFGYIGKPTEMGLAIAAGALTVIFLNIDKFQSFSAAGVQAELKKAVEDAYAKVEELKELAKPFVALTFSNLTYDKRFVKMDDQEKLIYIDKVETLIDKLGINDDPMVKQSSDKYYNFTKWDYFRDFRNNLAEEVKNVEVLNELGELMKYGSTDFPSRELIDSILQKYSENLDAKSLSLLNEYETQIKKGH
jgi:hypothetical protein